MTKYFQKIGSKAIEDMVKCDSDGDPATFFRADGAPFTGGTWPSWFRRNAAYREISNGAARQLITEIASDLSLQSLYGAVIV